MTEKDNASEGVIRPRGRRVTTFADVVGPEKAYEYAQKKLEADRRVQKRRRELGGASWGLLELYGYREAVIPGMEDE